MVCSLRDFKSQIVQIVHALAVPKADVEKGALRQLGNQTIRLADKQKSRQATSNIRKWAYSNSAMRACMTANNLYYACVPSLIPNKVFNAIIN